MILIKELPPEPELLCLTLQPNCGIALSFLFLLLAEICPYRAFFAMDLSDIILLGLAWLESVYTFPPDPHNQSFFYLF